VKQKQQRHVPAHVVADDGGLNLKELVQLADTQGPDTALHWVKHQQQQFVDIVGSPKPSIVRWLVLVHHHPQPQILLLHWQ